MIRGIRFELPNERENSLERILDNFDISKLFWRVLFSDTFMRAGSRDDEKHLKCSDFMGIEFKEIVEKNRNYIIHLGILAFPTESKEEVCDYQTFLNSSAEFFVAIIDSILVDIYVKEKGTLELFEKAAQKHGFAETEFFTEENDRFVVWSG